MRLIEFFNTSGGILFYFKFDQDRELICLLKSGSNPRFPRGLLIPWNIPLYSNDQLAPPEMIAFYFKVDWPNSVISLDVSC